MRSADCVSTCICAFCSSVTSVGSLWACTVAESRSCSSTISTNPTRRRPCTMIVSAPSEDFSFLRITHAVPTRYISSGFGSSDSGTRCATIATSRAPVSARSSTLRDLARPTRIGMIVPGNTTASRVGKIANLAGISRESDTSTGCASSSTLISSPSSASSGADSACSSESSSMFLGKFMVRSVAPRGSRAAK